VGGLKRSLDEGWWPEGTGTTEGFNSRVYDKHILKIWTEVPGTFSHVCNFSWSFFIYHRYESRPDLLGIFSAYGALSKHLYRLQDNIPTAGHGVRTMQLQDVTLNIKFWVAVMRDMFLWSVVLKFFFGFFFFVSLMPRTGKVITAE